MNDIQKARVYLTGCALQFLGPLIAEKYRSAEAYTENSWEDIAEIAVIIADHVISKLNKI